MTIRKTMGNKDRLVEIFQRVNKVKLNEDLGFGPMDAKTALTRGFIALKNGQLTLTDGGSNTTTVQMTDDNSVVSINGVDKNKNQYVFLFQLEFNNGGQEGVYDVQGVQLKKFSYVSSDGSQKFDLDESVLKNFNSNYTNELFDIIDKYIDVKGPQAPEEIAGLDEAIALIDAIKKDSSPFGGKCDKMQTSKNYVDNKPTNSVVRVKSPELNKYVKEDVNNLLYYSQAARDKGSSFKTKLSVTYQYVLANALKDIGITVINIEDIDQQRYRITANYNGETRTFNINGEKFNTAAKVRALIQKALVKSLQEFDKPAMTLKMQPVVEIEKPIAGLTLGGVVENEDDDIVNQEIKRASVELQNPEDIAVDDEPTPEVSPEKRDKIYQAYDALVARNGARNPNYSPTTPEIMAELDRMAGIVKPKNTRTFPKEAEPYLQEEEKKKKVDTSSPFKQLGRKFKPKSQSKYPDKDIKAKTTVSIDESSDRDKYEDVVFLQGDEAFEPLERLDREGPDAALEYLKQWHYPGEHQGSQEEKHGREDKVYRKDGYVMSWNPRLGYIGLQYDMANLNEEPNPEASKSIEDIPVPTPGDDQISHQPMDDEEGDMGQMPGIGTDDNGMPIPAIEPDFDKMGMGIGSDWDKKTRGTNDGMSMEPEGDEVQQLSQDKEEAGELIPGGKGEGKTAGEFNPDQILMGLKVEMEHTNDPMYALEIVMDHLTEDPEYYTTKDNPEASAQANASADVDDKEMTDVLLGFKPHNVGDEVEDEETPEAPAEEPETEEEPEEEKEEMSEMLYENQIKIARETLSNRNVPTGMSKKDAVQLLVKHLIK